MINLDKLTKKDLLAFVKIIQYYHNNGLNIDLSDVMVDFKEYQKNNKYLNKLLKGKA